jgi:hypothetical protein
MRYPVPMGNPNRAMPSGPCSTCNANGGLWHGEPDTVHCLNSLRSHRHVMRGDAATIHTHNCWAPRTEPLKLSAVADLLGQIKAKAKARR